MTLNVNHNFISTLNLDKFNSSERDGVIAQLSQFNFNLLTEHAIKELKDNLESRKKGWANFLRRGVSKVHRYNTPKLISWSKLHGTEKQPLLNMFHRFKKHDHQRNELLISYREKNDMRLNIRSERHEMYQAFDLALLSHLDIDTFGIGLFELTCSVEMLAKTIRIYRIDQSGHARYDTLLNAISDYEKSKQIIVYRDFDKEKKVRKPMRIWLTVEFFKSRGYTEEELRNLLKSRERYLHKKGVFNDTRKKYQTQFLQRLDKAGVLNPPNSLVKKLVKIKNKLLDLHYEKESIKRAEKQKKQAEAEIKNSQPKVLTHQDIFNEFVALNNIAAVYKYKAQAEAAKNYPARTGDDYWRECLIKIGWIPPEP